MGPSGCGKTTLLEAICALRPLTSGQLWLDQVDVTHAAPYDRQVGYVPQDSVLFPNMLIEHQIAFSLDVRKTNATDRRERVMELANLMGIDEILRRYPDGLSGGERQRVALARAIAFRPKILCLDEPLSALDDETKSQISGLLKRIHESEQVSVLHITHNANDADELGTTLFEFQDGHICQAELTKP